MNRELALAILDLVSTSRSQGEIAAAVRRSPATVSRILKALGVPFSGKRGRRSVLTEQQIVKAAQLVLAGATYSAAASAVAAGVAAQSLWRTLRRRGLVEGRYRRRG